MQILSHTFNLYTMRPLPLLTTNVCLQYTEWERKCQLSQWICRRNKLIAERAIIFYESCHFEHFTIQTVQKHLTKLFTTSLTKKIQSESKWIKSKVCVVLLAVFGSNIENDLWRQWYKNTFLMPLRAQFFLIARLFWLKF